MQKQRNTRQRALILEAALNDHGHPSADDIYLRVRARDPKISRGTVYRNLHLLVENGELHRVQVRGVDRFDWRTERHNHFRCRGCGKVLDAPLPYSAEFDRRLAERTGFRVEGHSTVFEGLCLDCQEPKTS